MTHMTKRFCPRLFVDAMGERHSIPIAEDGGVDLWPMYWSVTELRPQSGSNATIEQGLRGPQELHTWATGARICLQDRLATGRGLDEPEIEGLIQHMASGASGGRRRRAPLSAATRGTRLRRIARYLAWWGEDIEGGLRRLHPSDRARLRRAREDLEARLLRRVPRVRGEPGRLSLERCQMAALLAAVDAPEGPWQDPFVGGRNWLLILWALHTGLRIGELLGIRISDLDLEARTVLVARRPDSPDDPRRRQPTNKCRERPVGLPSGVVERTRRHLACERPTVLGSRGNPFLFVSGTGRPLSASTVTRMYGQVREAFPAVGPNFCGHVLRHTWNEAFSRACDAAGVGAEDEARQRAYLMGWASEATAKFYLRRHTRERADALNEAVQAEFEALRSQANG